jgi:hypothetical protein
MLKFNSTVSGLILAVAGIALAPSTPAAAQDAVLADFYGNGVHSYYDRDYNQAMAELNMAIDGGTKDPRAYYYRSLTHRQLGNPWAAEADLQVGAALETADVNQFYPVAKSLERIQGHARQQIEKHRAVARAQARQRQVQRDAVRYEQRRKAEANVLRNVPVAPAPADLFPKPAVTPAPTPGKKPVPPQNAETDELFSDPVTTPAAKPADKPAAEAPAADAATEDPFPADPAAEEPAAEEPAAEEAPAEEAPADEMPAEETPAAKEADEDPFGDEPK